MNKNNQNHEGISYEYIVFKQSVVEYSLKHGVTKAAIRYKQHRKTIYRWIEKYDGTRKSLVNKSRKPHSHPNAHTEQEIAMIKKFKAHNKKDGLVVLWIKLWKNEYTRSITSLYRVMQRMGIYKKAPSKKKAYEPKPYQQVTHPGERIQIDVKYVPSKCMSKELVEMEEKYYQYTAIDEYTRQRLLWASKDHNTTRFLEIIIKKFKYNIECVQTDNV